MVNGRDTEVEEITTSYVDVVEKIEPITVLIVIEYCETHVRVRHIHVLRKKR